MGKRFKTSKEAAVEEIVESGGWLGLGKKAKEVVEDKKSELADEISEIKKIIGKNAQKIANLEMEKAEEMTEAEFDAWMNSEG